MTDMRDARVVVVDDSRFDREVVRDALSGLGEIELCEDAEAALESLRRKAADLVISDITMPRMSGLQLLERIRREQPGTDFILLTGDASVESAIEALRMGASDYLIKPLRQEQLRRAVDQVLLRRHLMAENRSLRDALHAAEACRQLTNCLDPSEVYAVALDLLLGTLARSRGFAMFHRTSLPESGTAAFRGLGENESTRLREILLEDKPVDLNVFERIEQITHGPLHSALLEAGISPETLLVVPIRGQDSEAGVAWVFAEGREFEAHEIEMVEIVASHASAALENAERYHNAKERAFIDDVTEVYNARYLLSATENEIRRAERYEHPLSVLFLDLDRFKLVNDRYGHLLGSQTLRNLSQVLLQGVREVDTLARYGGDEFTILLVDTAHQEAMLIAERIRRSVEEHVFEAGRNGTLRLTVSVGVATHPSHGTTRESLLENADKAMYRAKSMGRNRVCSADELTS